MLYVSPDGRLSFRALFTIRRSRTAPLFEVVDVVLPFYLAVTAIASGAYDRRTRQDA